MPRRQAAIRNLPSRTPDPYRAIPRWITDRIKKSRETDDRPSILNSLKGFIEGAVEGAGELFRPSPEESVFGLAGMGFQDYVKKGILKAGQTYHGTQKWKSGDKIDFDRFDKSDVLGWMFHSAEDPEYAGKYAMGQAKGTWISPSELYDPYGLRDPQGKKLQPQMIPLEIDAKNVLDLVDPNADDMSQALAALSPHKRAQAIDKFKQARRDARRQKEYAERQYTQNPKLKETSPNMGSANNFLESQIGRHAPTEPVDWGEVPVRLLADDIRMSPKEFDQSPFDAIRYHDMDQKSWAVPSRTQIRSALNNEELVNLPKELPSFKTLESAGGKAYPRDPILALNTQQKLDVALEEGMISKEEYDMMINEILLSTPHPYSNPTQLGDFLEDTITGYSKNDIAKGKVPKNSAISSTKKASLDDLESWQGNWDDAYDSGKISHTTYVLGNQSLKKGQNPFTEHGVDYDPGFFADSDIDPLLEDFIDKDFSIKGKSGNVMITGTDQIKIGKTYKVTKPDGNHFIFNTLDGGDTKALAEDFGQGFQIEEMSNTSLLDQYTSDFAQKGLGASKKPWQGMGQPDNEIVEFLKLSGYLHKNTLEPIKKNIVNLEHLQKAANQENLTKPEIIYLADKYGIDHTQIKFKDNNFELENEPEFDPAYDIGSPEKGSALGNFIADTPEAMADPFVAKYNALPNYSKSYIDNYLKNIGGPEALSKDTIDEAMIAGHLEKPEYEYLMDVLNDVHKKALPDKNIMSTYNQPSKTKKTLSGFNLADYSDTAQKEYNGLLSVGYTEKEAKQIIWEKYK